MKTAKIFRRRWSSVRPGRLLLLVSVLAVILAAASWAVLLSPVQWFGAASTKRIIITPGSTARSIAEQLVESRLIRNAFAWRLLGRVTGKTGSMQAGVYDFSPREDSWTILQRLHQGDDVDLSVSVTIPEGYTVKQIATVLESAGICSAEELLEYLRTAPLPYDFLEQQLAGAAAERRFEGLLFPDSYRLMPDSHPEDVVEAMTRRFRQVVESLVPAEVLRGGQTSDTPVPMNLAGLVTLASIIEREAVVDEERPIIAGVFYNRLEIGQALQSCATVQYILEKNKPVLSTADTQIESPYNTYRYAGLTPGPIAAPGLHSLQAAVNPADTDKFYLYAIGDGSGKHVFSRTFEEHNQAIRSLRDK